MIKNYLLIVFRTFRKDTVNSFINLFGLTIGLASVMLIISYVFYELSFDTHYSNSPRIYQLVMDSEISSPAQKTANVPEPLAKTLQLEMPEIEASTNLHPYQATYSNADKPFELDVLNVNPQFFDIFNLPFLEGNPATALDAESNVVLTSQAAQRLFPDQKAIGKTISRKFFDGTVHYYTISGIIQNIPANTHFNADVIVASAVLTKTLDLKAYSSLPQYVLFKKPVDPGKIEARIQRVLKKYNRMEKTRYFLLPVADIHLYSADIASSNFNLGNIRHVYMITSVAVLILLIGGINYVNLTTAQSLQRIKEIGVRKTLGSSKRQLILQFLAESLLFFGVATVLAALLSLLVWPVFSNYLQVDVPVSDLLRVENSLFFGAVSLLAGLLAGSYPAFLVSQMQPAGLLKGNKGGIRINLNLRSALIVFQFAISVILIVATMVIYMQLDLFHNRPLGFNKSHLLTLPQASLGTSENAFKQAMLEDPNIQAVTYVDMQLGENIGSTASITDPSDSEKRLEFGFVRADADFIETMGIRLREGRNYWINRPSDVLNYDSLSNVVSPEKAGEIAYQKPIIITRSLAKALGLKKPVHTVLELSVIQGEVIGVVEDFQFTSLKKRSPLLVYSFTPKQSYPTTYIRINSRNIPQSIRHIERTSKQFFPGQVFTYSFAEDNLNQLYQTEDRLASLFSTFALLAIGLSSLGLFSLVALMVRQRSKEIGIRKVMGASVTGIMILLSRDFARLILVGAAIALPFAWYAMDWWLQDFAHRIHIHWSILLLAALTALLTGLVTVSFQTRKAAGINPVDSLKT